MDIPTAWVHAAALALWRADDDTQPFPGPHQNRAAVALDAVSADLERLLINTALRQRDADAATLAGAAAGRLMRGLGNAEVYRAAADVIEGVPAVNPTTE